ncbi:MAG: D-glycero-beta-D-manno-heptose-7-phosphate kinase [Parachlamydiaceae bacterium]|nr:D-glycero-beta-D-manno-heptose-7-phosphate kinase [Parachlamydiaceae bacterium]
MVRLTGVLNQFSNRKVLVAGDLMLDTYTIGKVQRISPEAPVAVVLVQREEHRPGGAGNVILNLVSLGAQVVAVGRIGADPAGRHMQHALSEEGVDTRGIFVQKDLMTPVKNRVLADSQQIVRVDHEWKTVLSHELEQEIIAKLPELLKEVDVVAISDYGKGFLSKGFLAALISEAKKQKIPVIADPKGVDFSKYKHATIVKPNLGEAYAAANLTPDMPLELAAERILDITNAETIMVTRSEAGISLFHRNGQRQDFPVRIREVKDVTGAGDTVLATLAYALANELPLPTAVQLSNVTAGMAIERFGCARITMSELARRLLEDDVSNKVFDDEHLFALQAALGDKKFVLLSLSGEEGLTSKIFSTICNLARQNELLIYIRDPHPDEEFIKLLASIHDVAFIVLKTESIHQLFDSMNPEQVHLVEV